MADDASWAVLDETGKILVRSANRAASPLGALAVRIDGNWQVLDKPDAVQESDDRISWQWTEPAATLTFEQHELAALRLHLSCAEANAVFLGWHAEADEHFYGLGERFDTLDQRGKVIELWAKNGASGFDTYKPVPWIASSKSYGIAIDTSHRVFVSLAHLTTPAIASVTVEASEVSVLIFAGESPIAVLGSYTAWIGRPPVPPSWFFRPWKSHDWRVENQATALDDLAKQQEFDLPLGAKLIDARWEEEDHNFTFTTERYPDAVGMIDILNDAGVELVLWISPNMTVGSRVYDECARAGFFITNDAGEPYVHRLGNQPGWEGSAFDFTNPAAVAWWQAKVRSLMEMGVRGLKTDFGEQIPEDAHFANGKTGREMHNVFPVLYNAATWEIVREYDGVLMARSAWAGSQRYPGIWAGDQSADFSPWAGLPTVIVAGQSAGWSGFPYWGSDVGGYFNAPDDEVFTRWAQFSAVSPLMQPHGLGKREPWEFSAQTLDSYRRMAKLHDALMPYSLMAAHEASATGLPLLRAMVLLYPDSPEAYLDWVRYQFHYGPDLLAAPVYSWGESRSIWFPPGEWIDFATGAIFNGPQIARVSAPLEKLPLYVQAGSVVVTANAAHDVYELLVFPGSSAIDRHYRLPDGVELHVRFDGISAGDARIDGATLPIAIRLPHRAGVRVEEQTERRWTFHF